MGLRFSGTTGKVNLMSKYGVTNQDHGDVEPLTSQNCWLQHQWLPKSNFLSIAVKEMISVVLAAALWGQTWKGKIVCFNSDSQAVVEVL